MNQETRNFEQEQERKILDSGNRREFASGAVRDIAEGKGRCDLLPLDIVGEYLYECAPSDDQDKWQMVGLILTRIDEFIRSGNDTRIYECLSYFMNNEASSPYKSVPKAMIEVSKHYEEGSKKYAERNWEKGISCHCYVDSGVRHLLKWLDGWDDEPHDRAFIWNMLGLLWTVKHRPECNDLPYELLQKEASEAEDKEWGTVEERLGSLK